MVIFCADKAQPFFNTEAVPLLDRYTNLSISNLENDFSY